jgi:hypothetical protein
MERELWNQLYVLVVAFDNQWTKGLYRHAEILVVYLWAVIHDRPTSWACDPRNWGAAPPSRLPSQSTMSRRLRNRGVEQLLARVEAELGGDPRQWWVQRIDSKPLPIGPYSKDTDAKCGRAGKGFARGYKLHAVWGGGVLPSVWRIEPMNTHDSTAGKKLLPDLPGEGYVVGDGQYDSNPLHKVAAPRHQIVAPQRRGKGLGCRRHEPSRLHCVEMTKREFGKALLRFRVQIERCFGNLTSFAAGLGPLPSWVRRLYRVKLWVQAKLLINALRQSNGTNPRLAPA